MDIIKEVKKLNLPFGQYVVIGSGLLDALGLREADDIDIAVTKELLEKLRAEGGWKEETRYNKPFLLKENIEIIGRLNWDDYPTPVETAIETALVIEGVPFLSINETKKFKTALGRKKDFIDIELLDKYEAKN